jgi:hypothetical protein
VNATERQHATIGLGHIWFYDRAIQTLVFVEQVDEEQHIHCYPRVIWERIGFCEPGMQGLPIVPNVLHEAIVTNHLELGLG